MWIKTEHGELVNSDHVSCFVVGAQKDFDQQMVSELRAMYDQAMTGEGVNYRILARGNDYDYDGLMVALADALTDPNVHYLTLATFKRAKTA